MKPLIAYHKILPQPAKPKILPPEAKWLSGEGCGSWFHILGYKENYIITRYSPEGKKECSGIFSLQNKSDFELHTDFEMAYLSHCSEVNVIQNEEKLKFVLIEKRDV